MTEPVAITGLGAVSTFGVGVDALWEALLAGRTNARKVAAFDGGLAATVPALAAREFGLGPGTRRIDRNSLLALVGCRLALADAGLAPEGLVPERTGLVLGSAFGNLEETAGFLDRIVARGAGNPLVFPNLVMNAPLSYATIDLGVTGPTAMLTEQEATGERVVAFAADLVADGECDVCLAGATDELTDVLYGLRARYGAASSPARPLDRDGGGACPGEGAGALVLEPLGRARRRGARVYAVVVPQASVGLPAPIHGWPRDAAPLAAALAPVVADADLVVAAANGTPALDAVEAEALARALAGRDVAVTAPRGATGDFGAAGILAVVTAARALAAGVVPPTPGCRLPARADLPVVVERPQRRALRTAVVHGLARGGLSQPVRLEGVPS